MTTLCDLAKKDCVPCKGGIPPLKGEDLYSLYHQLGSDWNLVEDHHLEKQYKLKNWAKAIDLTNRISEIAEHANHHPDLEIGWGKVKVTIFSHKIDGLTETDFVFAARVEEASQAVTAS